MSDDMKYVLVETPGFGLETMIIFPSTLEHRAMAVHGKPISAGFIRRTSNESNKSGFRCYGRSVSLNLDSRPDEDQYFLDRLLGDKED